MKNECEIGRHKDMFATQRKHRRVSLLWRRCSFVFRLSVCWCNTSAVANFIVICVFVLLALRAMRHVTGEQLCKFALQSLCSRHASRVLRTHWKKMFLFYMFKAWRNDDKYYFIDIQQVISVTSVCLLLHLYIIHYQQAIMRRCFEMIVFLPSLKLCSGVRSSIEYQII